MAPRKSLSIALFCAIAATTAVAADTRRKVIIDQDAFGPAGSNLQSILMLVQDPGADVLGIAIESGDGWQKENVAHTLRMLELIGRPDIPVVPGATNPLINSQEGIKRWEMLYGKLGYKGAWTESWPAKTEVNRPKYHPADVVPPLEEGDPQIKPAAEAAAVFMVRKVREFPGQVSFVAMGPFTNFALAARLDDDFAANAKEIVLMGGSFDPNGYKSDEFSLRFINRTRIEFNMRWDPEAARIMLHAGWKKITVVPTDATLGTRFTAEVLRRATEGSDTPAARYTARFAQIGFPMWDEETSAVFLHPEIVRRADRLAMDVDIIQGPNYGATLSWFPGAGPGLGEPDVTVVRAIDIPRMEAIFVEEVRRPPQAP